MYATGHASMQRCEGNLLDLYNIEDAVANE